jgi:hypothetical protein
MAAHPPQCASQPGAVMRGAGFCTTTGCGCPAQLDEAESLYARCIAIKERSLGAAHPQARALAPSTPSVSS